MRIVSNLRRRWAVIISLALAVAVGSPFSQAGPTPAPTLAARINLVDVPQAATPAVVITNSQLPAIELRTNRVELAPDADDALIAKLVSIMLTRSHYLGKPFNEEVSSKFLDQYLDALDPAHMIFFQTDLNEFEPYRKVLDRKTKRGDTSPGDVIFNRYLQRIDQQAAYVKDLLQTNVFVFDTDERYPLNRKDAPRPANLEAAQQLWRDRVRFEYLQEKLDYKQTNAIESGVFRNVHITTQEKLDGKKPNDAAREASIKGQPIPQANIDEKKPEEIKTTILRRYARTQRFLKEWDDSDVLQLYLTALAHVFDPHSDYMGGPQMENFNIGMKLSLFGIGALLKSEDGYCIIDQLTPGGPAIKSGKLRPGDKIIAVAQGDDEPVEVVDMKLTKVVELIRGPKNTKVRLTIIPALAANSSVRRTIVLVRDEIRLEAREAKAEVIELADAKKTRLGVIDLQSFYTEFPTPGKTNGLKSTTTDVARLLKKLQQENVAGIILDLRHNGGGSLEEAIKLTGLFITEGPVVQVKDREGDPIIDYDPDPSVAYDGPLIVLTSRFSASASEILAGALQDYGRALVVGDISTHGKGTVQQLIPLDSIVRQTGQTVSNNPGALKITIRKFFLPKGASTQKVGVTPDIILPSVNNFAEVGESSLPNCLEGGSVPSAKFQPLNRVQPYLAELRQRSAERVIKDEDFCFVQEDIERFKKSLAEKSVSLNEKERRKEKEEIMAIQQARKKELAKRPDTGEKVYELTLKVVDLPGLPPPLAKTNTTKLAQVGASAEAGGETAATATNPVVERASTAGPKQSPTGASTNAASASPDSTRDELGMNKNAGKSSDDDAKSEEDEMPLVDVDLKEAERILADFILLANGRPPTNSVVDVQR